MEKPKLEEKIGIEEMFERMPPPRRQEPKPILHDLTALAYLQSIYRDPNRDDHERMRAAIYALPMESPKLQAIAVTPMSDDLAAMLDRAIAASRMVKEERAGRLIEAKANPRSDDAPPTLVDGPSP